MNVVVWYMFEKNNSSIDKEPLWVGQHFHDCTESSLFDERRKLPPPPPKKEENNYCKNVCKRIDIFNSI